MLTLVLCLALVLPGDSSPAGPERRLAAAEALRAGISEGEAAREHGASALAPLLQRALHASEELSGSHLAVRLERLADAARWRALVDSREAASWLESELEQFASDLVFEPVIESELPVGFPAPTPVREIELKLCPEYRMARAPMGNAASQGAFWKLFNHIQTNDIAMTAPVEMSYESGDGGLRESSMAFLYGRPDLGELGADSTVEVLDVAPSRVASLGCRGWSSSERIAEARDELLAWIAERPELAVAGEVRVMSYNSPRIRSSRRYYEVQIPVNEVENTVVDFSDPGELDRWGAVDDVVMGGRSGSGLERTEEGIAAFVGKVSLENNGGFASIRSRALRDGFGDAASIVLRCRGDGKTYKLRLQTRALRSDAMYQASFTTSPGEWTEHRFEASDFTAVWRGRTVRDAPRLELAQVESLGLMISDGQEGPFRLELGSIRKR